MPEHQVTELLGQLEHFLEAIDVSILCVIKHRTAEGHETHEPFLVVGFHILDRLPVRVNLTAITYIILVTFVSWKYSVSFRLPSALIPSFGTLSRSVTIRV